MAYQLFTIAPEHIDRAWRDGAHNLAHAVKLATGECTADQLKYKLAKGEHILLHIRDENDTCLERGAWLAVHFIQCPNVRLLHIAAIYAPGATADAAFDMLKAYAVQGGASAIQGACNDAVAKLWAKRFDFKQAYKIMRCELWTAAAAAAEK